MTKCWWLVLACAAIIPCQAQNLVANGGFADGSKPWFRAHKSAPGAIEVVPRDGEGSCLKLTSNGEWVDLMQPLSLAPGARYVFQCDLKRTAAGDDIRAMLIPRRANGTDEYHSIGSSQTRLQRWEHFARVVRTPGKMESSRVLLMNRLKGADAWFADLQVVPVSRTSPPAPDYSPKLDVPKVETAPTINGQLAEGEWDDAGRITGLVRIKDGANPEASTEAWVCHDGLRLLIAARCEEPLMAQGRFNSEGHDAGGVFADEVVEIFIDPDNDHKTYYHFAISGRGADYDASLGEGAVEGAEFESGWAARAYQGPDFWSVEAAIPFAALETGAAGDIWGLNICRERHVPGHAENTAWAATGTSFHVPAKFGDLVGLRSVARPKVVVEVLGVDQPTPGPASLSVRVNSRLVQPASVSLVADIAAPGGEVLPLTTRMRLEPGASAIVALPFDIPVRGSWQVSVRCLDESGSVLFAAPPHRFTVAPLLQARVVNPWYRGRIFSKMDLREVQIEARIGLRDPAAQGLALDARILAGEREVARVTTPVGDAKTTVRLPCADLDAGTHTVRVGLIDAGGRELANVAGLPLEKLPTATDELWFDRDNNLIVNGTAHFPTGFYSVDWIGRMNLPAEGSYTLFHTYASSTAARLDPATTDWDWQKWLDTGASHGMRAFLGIGYAGDRSEDFYKRLVQGEAKEPEQQMREFIDRWKQHPGLGAWYLYDEPALSGRTVDQIKYLYRMADGIDPYHPKVICQVLWSDRRYVPWLDVLMPDPYPIRAANSRPLRSVATAVRAARRTVGDEKPVWPVLQWYQYPGGRYPTPREMRCMAFLAVTAGAKGLTWYGFYHGYKGDQAHWPQVAQIGRELRSIEDIVLAPYADEAPALEPGDAPVEVLVKQTPGRLHLIVVNYEGRATGPIHFTLPQNASSARERLGGTNLPITANHISLSLESYEPAVIDVELAQ